MSTTNTIAQMENSGSKSNQSDPEGSISPEEIIDNLQSITQSEPSPDDEITGEYLLNRNVDQIECLIDPIFQKIGVVALVGSSDVGKSTFLRQLAIAVSCGHPHFLGWVIKAKHNSAIIVSSEDLENEMAFLLKKFCRSKNIDSSELKNLRFIFETENLIPQLDRKLTSAPADLVIVDCYADLYRGRMNETNQIRTFLNDFLQLARKHGCLIIFLHHTGKRTEDSEPSKNNILGGQGFESKMRMVIELRADPMNPRLRHLCIVKGNYLPAEYKQESFVLQFNEDLSFDETGDRIPFHLLAKNDAEGYSRAKYEQAKELKQKGHSHDAIAKMMGYGNKGSVSKLLKKFDGVSQETVGNDGETKPF